MDSKIIVSGVIKVYENDYDFMEDKKYINKGMVLEDLQDWLRQCVKYESLQEFSNLDIKDAVHTQTFNNLVIEVLQVVKNKITELEE